MAGRQKNRTFFREFTKPLDKLRRKIGYIGKTLDVDTHSKKLNLEKHALTMINQVVEECNSLRDVSRSTKNTAAKEKGLVEISHNRMSEVNRERDYRAFVWIFYELAHIAIRQYHLMSKIKETFRIIGIDSTFIVLKTAFSKFGYSGNTKQVEEGIKVHIASMLGWLSIPISVFITPGDVGDSVLFEDLLKDASSFTDLNRVILVFDRGYWNYKRFKDLVEGGIRFVVGVKSNTKYDLLSEKKGNGFIDRRIRLKRNRLELRLVTVYTQDGIFEYLTNIYDLSPFEIKTAYEQRWDMEIINHELKQNLRIDHFMGESLNAVLVQIFCTLICYLLIAIFRIMHNSFFSVIEIKRTLKYQGNMGVDDLQEIYPCLSLEPS